MKKIFVWSIMVFFMLLPVYSSLFGKDNPDQFEKVTPEQRERSVQVLREILKNENLWHKIRAAEYLLALDYPQEIKQRFENKLIVYENESDYIAGIWVILAKTTYHSERDIWIEKIRTIFDEPDSYSNYAIYYAAEALSDLNYQFTEEEEKKYQEILKKEKKPPFTIDDKAEKCNRLANAGTNENIPWLLARLNDPDPIVRIEAANAVLRIERRITSPTMSWLSWLIIGIYGIGMVGVGYYYLRRMKSAEDYLLGGRTMNSMVVGLSLFATMLSTISYLSSPGEMIKNGPMNIGGVIAFPIIFWIVGWYMIPYIMHLKVTSAYEILERRFDGSIRTLSSLMFLSLRLLWMATIIYATVDLVLIPLTGLDPDLAPWVCVILGVVTLLYTSMGGIRGVVMTDAIQFFILWGGAFLVLILITIKLGGISEWWPSSWPDHWEAPRWGFQTSGQQRTFGWFILSTVAWFICTNGSDQMAIQRFLSTRDVRGARKVLGTSLLSSMVVKIFLGILGLALLAYFRANPHILQDGQSIHANADELLPQYIITSLPFWASGLVIAGLLAAAMSSLSSGVNSSSAVITEDLIYRFQNKKMTEKMHLNTAKLVSVGVGILVVAMSLYVYAVPGNLLEVTYRVVNLLTAPLFVMFFMAMFVPWASVFGTWVGTIASTAFAVAIAYWESIFATPGPSFLYIIPGSLVVGALVGAIFSLIPIGSEGVKEAIEKWRSLKQ